MFCLQLYNVFMIRTGIIKSIERSQESNFLFPFLFLLFLMESDFIEMK